MLRAISGKVAKELLLDSNSEQHAGHKELAFQVTNVSAHVHNINIVHAYMFTS